MDGDNSGVAHGASEDGPEVLYGETLLVRTKSSRHSLRASMTTYYA